MPLTYRKYSSSLIAEEDGWIHNKILSNLTKETWDHGYSEMSAQDPQPKSRFSVMLNIGLKRVEIRSNNFPVYLQNLLDSSYLPICFESVSSVLSMQQHGNHTYSAEEQIPPNNHRENLTGYAIPPFCLIGKLLKKVQARIVTIILVPPS